MDCLPDGTRLVLAEPSDSVGDDEYYSGVSRAIWIQYDDDSVNYYWVYVRTPSGVEGWVAHGYEAIVRTDDGATGRVAREYLDWY